MRWYTDYEAKKTAALATLRQRPLYNVDFKDAKDSLNRAFESAFDAEVQDPFFFNGRYENVPEAVNNLTLSDWSLHRLPGLQKKVRACKADDPALTAMVLLLNDWEEAYEVLTAAKADAIKARKPSTTPRKTPARTIDNTGTCPVCGRNVKLKHGRIVDHGFEIKLGFRSGLCPGVNYHPWEQSPDGKIDYAEGVRHHLAVTEQGLRNILNDEPNPESLETRRKVFPLQSEIRFARKSLELLQAEIDGWKAQPLPGTK